MYVGFPCARMYYIWLFSLGNLSHVDLIIGTTERTWENNVSSSPKMTFSNSSSWKVKWHFFKNRPSCLSRVSPCPASLGSSHFSIRCLHWPVFYLQYWCLTQTTVDFPIVLPHEDLRLQVVQEFTPKCSISTAACDKNYHLNKVSAHEWINYRLVEKWPWPKARGSTRRRNLLFLCFHSLKHHLGLTLAPYHAEGCSEHCKRKRNHFHHKTLTYLKK